MNHKSYEKINENFHKWKLSEADYRRFNKVDWVVTEKIHGANFCVLTDGNTVQFAKRKELLESGEDFFGHSLIALDLQEKALLLHKKWGNQGTLALYGELFGGGYPHPGVAPNPGVAPVQTGIWYCPDIRFSVFDIALEGSEQTHQYLDFVTMVDLCEAVDLLVAEPLFIGKYEAALDYKIPFPSTLPDKFGLPALPGDPNHAEGVVIKPAVDLWIETAKGPLRPVLKKKIEKFSEDDRYAGAKKWQASAAPTEEQLKIDAAFMQREVLPLITKARLQAVISKIGRPTKRNRSRILEAFKQDVFESVRDNFPGKETQVDAALSTILAAVEGSCGNLLKKVK